jgi:hypothetical protein
LGQKLNKTVSWNDVISSQATETDKNFVRGLLMDAHIDQDGSPGSTTGVVKAQVNAFVPVLAWGLTDRFTLALAMPIMNIDMKSDLGFAKSGDGQKFVDQASAADPIKGNDAKDKLNQAIPRKLQALGYEPIENQHFTAIGDAKLVGKAQVYTDEKQSVAIKPEVTFPTGKRPNANRAVDLPTGDGQWDLGVGVAYERELLPSFKAVVSSGYTAQMPDQLERRIPKSATDSLSGDKELVSRDLGDQIIGMGGVNYTFQKVGINLGTAYSYQTLLKTAYSGTLFESERYRFLENEAPSQMLQSLVFSTGFSTVEFYKQKKFFYPFQVNMAYSVPIAGRNVTKQNVLASELVLFF